MGRGGAKRYGRAFELLDQACDNGHAEACIRQADMLERGTGIPRDPARAARVRRQACAMGHAAACPTQRGT